MKLTWRDGVTTVLAGAVLAVAFAVSGSWGWPLLGSYRAGVVALVVLAVPMCLIGGSAFWDSVAFRHPSLAMRDPFLAAAMLLGAVAMVVVIGGLTYATEAWFVALASLIGVLWLIATTRHAMGSEPRVGKHHLVAGH